MSILKLPQSDAVAFEVDAKFKNSRKVVSLPVGVLSSKNAVDTRYLTVAVDVLIGALILPLAREGRGET